MAEQQNKTVGKKAGQYDFSTGSIPKLIVQMSLPMMVAQLVNVLYNVVDRIYIGNIPGTGSLALAGVGIGLPLVSMVSAFTGLLGTGGVPLFSIARGKGDRERAEELLGHAFVLLGGMSLLILVLIQLFLKPVLMLFGATAESLPFAAAYMRVYLLGVPFSMLGLGLNGYINAQGFPRRGMGTVLLGALLNIVLDPIFIYTLKLGVAGAAWATVISQFASALWSLGFLFGRRPELRLQRSRMYLRPSMVGEMLSLGITNFFIHLTNALIQTVYNRQLGLWGGELHLSAMVIIQSLRTVFQEIVRGFAAGMQPVLGYNYGAGKKQRVLASIRFSATICMLLAILLWVVLLFPSKIIGVFTTDPVLAPVAARASSIYFCGYCFMALQLVGQNTYLALGKAKKALFFTLLRKVVVVVPLVMLLPGLGLGVDGVYWSEPVSDLLGGGACFMTMLLTVYFPIRRQYKEELAQ